MIAGNIKAESDYYPWGGELQIVNNDPGNHYKFTSKERDSESQLDYFGARYYGNALGRFVTPDWDGKPVTVPYAEFGDPQSLNLYSYVRNNPIPRIDPDGHSMGTLNNEGFEGFEFFWNAFENGSGIFTQPLGQDPEKPAEAEAREEAEDNKVLEAGSKASREAERKADANRQAELEAKGYDDPTTGVCYAPAAPEVSAPGTPAPSSQSPIFEQVPEFTPGGKTFGLLGNKGSRGIPIFSGKSGPAEQIPPGTPGFNAYTRTHVEGHAAAVMRLSGIKNATLILNNPTICPACAQNLPHMLPPGSTLTIVLPTGEAVVFTGNSR